jgi:hypothetical protein
MERFFRNHKRAIETAYRAARGEQVKEKYAFLRDYHNEILSMYLPNGGDLKVMVGQAGLARAVHRVGQSSTSPRRKKGRNSNPTRY